MNEDIKKRWIKALREGFVNGKDIIQGRGYLYKKTELGNQLCCLGVLCELAVEDGIIPTAPWKAQYGDNYISYLPPEVSQWAGLESSDPGVSVYQNDFLSEFNLSICNDKLGYSFDKIADVIEEQL